MGPLICYFSHACTRYAVLASKGADARPTIAASASHTGLKEAENQVNVLRGNKNPHTEISFYGNNITSPILLDTL